MLEVDEALAKVLCQVSPLESEKVALSNAMGRTLAVDAVSDVDSPPHDKSLVDGYAVQANDLRDGFASLEVIEEITAGQVPSRTLNPGQTARIMTGAPIPPGADAVVMVEDVVASESSQDRVTLRSQIAAGQNLQKRCAIMRSGETILKAGTLLHPTHIGLLAETGNAFPIVHRQPSVAILPTGDELVDPTSVPGPGQIRNSNGPMLAAISTANRARPLILGVGRDNESELASHIKNGLEHDVFLLSGGVSMGTKDYVPNLLVECGVQAIFHKIQLRPGKPLWFGIHERNDKKTFVFGLPGNPVSSFVCASIFVRPVLEMLCGLPVQDRKATKQLSCDFEAKGRRTAYLPARHCPDDSNCIKVLPWQGSADQRVFAEADCLAIFQNPGRYVEGDSIEVLSI